MPRYDVLLFDFYSDIQSWKMKSQIPYAKVLSAVHFEGHAEVGCWFSYKSTLLTDTYRNMFKKWSLPAPSKACFFVGLST